MLSIIMGFIENSFSLVLWIFVYLFVARACKLMCREHKIVMQHTMTLKGCIISNYDSL